MKHFLILLVAILAMAFCVTPVFASDYGRDGPADYLQSIQKDISIYALVENGPAPAATVTFIPYVDTVAIVGFDTGDEVEIIVLSPNDTDKGSSLKYCAYIVGGNTLYLHVDKGAFAYSMARHVFTVG